MSVRRLLLTAALVLTLAASQFLIPSSAQAGTEEIFAEANELQLVVEQTAMEYNAAIEKVIAIEAKIAETQLRIDDLEALLPGQRERSSSAMNEYYRMNATGNLFLELIFGARSFSELLASYEYALRLQNSCLAELNRTKEMVAALTAARESLEADRREAIKEKIHVEEALAAAQAAREDAQRRYEEAKQKELDEIKRLAQEARNNAALEAGNLDGNGPTPISWLETKEEFVAEWAPRIDDYFAGFPLAGYGWVFAEAAWDYAVDPRWSPAISCTESTKGKYCYRPHNAWGWGGVSWPDWETAIRAHVRGLANGYGYTISIAAAKKYCPPNWEHWYIVTASQMERI